MTEKPIRIPLGTRVMPSIIAHDIKGVSPMIGPVDSVINVNMITERQGEGQMDIEADLELLRKNLDAARLAGDIAKAQKLQQQISLLEDSVVIYRLSRPVL